MCAKQHMHNIQGFSLAELLTAIAILLILAAIAIPSIISAQKNMLLAELDSSAAQIAQASQNQMTAKKVSGTWVGLLDGLGIVEDQKPDFEGNDDLCYFTADQARKNGILPRNSIDDTVYEGDLVIEFNTATATVSRVFFADGRAGFFSGVTDPAGKALAYYDEGRGATDKGSRLHNSPLIGYYRGTPAGATNTVALAKPVIWMNDTGKLCIENVNLSSGKKWGEESALCFKISNREEDREGASLEIHGLQGPSVSPNPTFSVNLPDGSAIGPFADRIFEMGSRDPLSADDVYEIDLNALKRVLTAFGEQSGRQDVVDLVGRFHASDNLLIEATVTTTVPAEPGKATAYVQWPGQGGTIRVLVTDPWITGSDKVRSTNKPNTLRGTYFAPEVKAVSVDGEDPVTGLALEKDAQSFALVEGSNNLWDEAKRQVYSGGWGDLEEIAGQKALVQAKVGSYASTSGTFHQYQVFEVWLNGQKIGYLRNNQWVWTDLGWAVSPCIAGLASGTDTVDVSNITIDAGKLLSIKDGLASYGITVDELTFYVRTTPKIAEVEHHFRSLASSIGDVGTGSVLYSRRSGISTVRNIFENEFGAHSAIAVWTITRDNTARYNGINGFPETDRDIRVYYAGVPALGFDGNSDLNNLANKLENAALFYYRDGIMNQSSSAMVQDARAGEGESLYLVSAPGNSSEQEDFALPQWKDYLFYRVLFYYNVSGDGSENNRYKRGGQNIPAQYVPHSERDNAQYAQLEDVPEIWSGYVSEWLTDETYPTRFEQLCKARALVGIYDDQLAYGRVNLQAKFTLIEESIGLVYFEKYSDGAIGVYGYTSGTSGLVSQNMLEAVDARNRGITITEWGYYVLVPKGVQKQVTQNVGLDQPLSNTGQEISVGGRDFICHYPYYDEHISKLTQLDAVFKLRGSTVQTAYSFNVNFAKAVSTESGVAGAWGNEASPYLVRHADHFFGRLSIRNVQAEYFSSAFKQELDIDLSGKAIKYIGGNFPGIFQGIYDGGNCLISAYRIALHSDVAENHSGLFLRTIDATLKNIHLADIDQGRPTPNVVLGTASSSYGVLVGMSVNTLFENCTVNGFSLVEGIERPTEVIIIHDTANNRVSVGTLVGTATNCTFKDCAAKGFKITIDKPALADTGSIVAGGAIGHVIGTQTAIQRTGTGKRLAQSIDFLIPGQSDTATRLHVGGIAGYQEGVDIRSMVDTGFFDTVRCSYDDVTYTAVEAVVGNTGP